MSRWYKAVVVGVVLALLIPTLSFSADCREIRETVVRVHILANSDSEQDQTLKLKVRDAVTAAGAHLLDGTESAEEAREKIAAALPSLKAVAQACVLENGYTYEVNAQLTQMYFTTRTYDSGTLPAGIYDAVRFTIGNGEGRNWWCVLYPPLCVGAAVDADTLQNTLGDDQAELIQHPSRYQVRFKVVEWWEELCNLFR